MSNGFRQGKTIVKTIQPVILSWLASAALATIAVACSRQSPEGKSPSPDSTSKASKESGRFTLGPIQKHPGQQDGSAGVALDEKHFVAATDENNILRLYSTENEEPGKELIDLNTVLGFPKEEGEFKECDIEGATRFDANTIFWIGSHGRNKNGKVKESRRVFFATTAVPEGTPPQVSLKGSPCKSLMEAFEKTDYLKEAAKKKPEEEGGFNIEGLCAYRSQLLIGFRNPIPDAKAVVIPLENPAGVIAGEPPKLGAPIRLNLGGLGIRDMASWHNEILILAGDYKDRAAGAKPQELYRWSGDPKDSPVPIAGTFGDLNPEAVLVYGEKGSESVQVLSDDGGDAFRSAFLEIQQ
jgi:hypothetical protein